MNAEKGYEIYGDVKDGQDLLDMGVKPKDASEMLTVITSARLRALRDSVSATLDERLIGEWIPAFVKNSDKYTLGNGVVAEDKLGWFTRFNNQYSGQCYDTDGNERKASFITGSTGVLRKVDSNQNLVTLSLDQKVDGRNIYIFRTPAIASLLDVSSLGQRIPQERENIIYDEAMSKFFPVAVLDTDRAARWITGMLMDKDLVAYGTPGSGKSTLARDTVKIMSEQGVRFEVEGCNFGCNPFSLFDKAFAKDTPPCPECMDKYNGNKKVNFRKTGTFSAPLPKDVKVRVVTFGDGHGASYIEGNGDTRRAHLVGYKMPKLDGTSTDEMEDQYSLKGFSPGPLPASNNGICHMDELDKMRETTRDSVLEATSNNRVKPDQVMLSVPCKNVIVGTANDATVLSQPFKDRFFTMAIRPPKSLTTAQRMIRSAYFKERGLVGAAIDIGDVHTVEPGILRDLQMPMPVQNAVASVYYKLGKEYSGRGKADISGSTRPLFDGLDVARAQLLKDEIFFKKTPEIVTPEYAVSGLQFALCARITNATEEEDKAAKEEIKAWIADKFPAALKEEENTWWCNFYKQHLEPIQAEIPEISSRFQEELGEYKKNPSFATSTHKMILDAQRNPTNPSLTTARLQYPFMDYLFIEQPRLPKATEGGIVQLTEYYLKAQETATCKLNSTP